jgi:hypothetical protein
MASAKKKKSEYYVLDSESRDMMLFYPPENPSIRDGWMGGHRFRKPPSQPITVIIRPKNEKGDLLPYHGSSYLMSDEFYKALREAGVDNLEVFDAIIQSKDGSVVRKGYKVFNLVGVVQAADLKKTIFNDPPGHRLIDASIAGLEIDPEKAGDLLMFRLAEYVGAVIVHERVKRAIETKGFPHIVFRETSDFIS